jgi:phosphoglycolate phosphatase-like HAD superfamily hydrolase
MPGSEPTAAGAASSFVPPLHPFDPSQGPRTGHDLVRLAGGTEELGGRAAQAASVNEGLLMPAVQGDGGLQDGASQVGALAPDTSGHPIPGAPDAVEAALALNAERLRGVPPPVGTVVLKPDQIVRIFSDYAVFDVDETQIEGTGEHVHDGPAGRFALALSQLLAAREGMTIPPTQSSFDSVTWQPYRACTGRSEPEVCKGMVDIANVAFFAERRELFISAEELMDASHKVLNDGWQNFVTKIRAIEGVNELLLKFRGAGVKLGICSASSEKFVIPAMSYLGLLTHFEEGATVTGATKKIEDGRFDGSDVAASIHSLGGLPWRSVMLGDSLSDYAAAALAGVPVIILRLPNGDKGNTLTSLIQQIRAWQAGQGQGVLKAAFAPTLMIVDKFSQVEIGGRLPEGENVFTRHQVFSPTAD